MSQRNWSIAPKAAFRLPYRSLTDTDYVIDIKCSSTVTNSNILASSSDFALYVIDPRTMCNLANFNAHTDRISSTQWSHLSTDIFYSASIDKSMKIWDLRQNILNPALQFNFDEEVQSFAVSSNEALMAVGLGNEVHFFDIRNGASNNSDSFKGVRGTVSERRLGVYADIHTMEITQLLFSPTKPDLLISGGEDGIICIYDTTIGEMGDTVVSILNSDCAINKIGFFGPANEGLYCISTIETLSLWHFLSAQRLADFSTIRDEIAVDYLVDCLPMAESGDLCLIAGTHDGAMKIISVEPTRYYELSNQPHGHNSTVRALCSLPGMQTQSNPLAGLHTCGEDGQILKWDEDIFQDDSAIIDKTNKSEKEFRIGPTKQNSVTNKFRSSPY